MKKILIIDDDLLFSDLLALELKEFQTTIANSVGQAIECLNQMDFDLIILDLLLPAYNGIGLLNEMVSSDLINKIPIIICSSVADKVKLEQFSGANVKTILDKTKMKPNDLSLEVKAVFND